MEAPTQYDGAISRLVCCSQQRHRRLGRRTCQSRIAIVRPAGSVALISATGNQFYRAFFKELRRLGDVEGQTLTVERYSGQGRPDHFADRARETVKRKTDLVVAIGDAIAQAARTADDTLPIVWVGADPIRAGLVTSLARPNGNITGVTARAESEIWGKHLQMLNEAVPSASKVAYLDVRTNWEADLRDLLEPSQQLQISLVGVLLEEATPTEYRRVFAEIAEPVGCHHRDGKAELTAYRQLIVELVNNSRLPATYPYREYVEVGGLMAYAVDLSELGQRAANDVHEILNATKPGDIPIYRPTKYDFVISLKAAKAIGLTIPPPLLALADEVI